MILRAVRRRHRGLFGASSVSRLERQKRNGACDLLFGSAEPINRIGPRNCARALSAAASKTEAMAASLSPEVFARPWSAFGPRGGATPMRRPIGTRAATSYWLHYHNRRAQCNLVK
jgi:hypothetical protein